MLKKSTARRRPVKAKPVQDASFPLPLAIAWSGVTVVFAILLSGYVFGLFNGGLEALAGSRNEGLSLVEKVARHISVNPSEDPTVATVQDPDSLKVTDPDFYAEVEVGDRLLVWSDKAVLYSESRDLILSVLPVRFAPPTSYSQGESTLSTSENLKESATIEIRNGTRRVGLARELAEKLADAGLNFEILKPRDAVRKDYQQTMVVKVTEKSFPQTEKNLLGVMGGQFQPLPPSETNVKGDFLIIIGADYPSM